ncbi:MAG TPA: LPS export ABC transporter permease LptF [Gammaproteobacteria bacterium]|nr:LPS export ABC transporter permease LptF [Gammaproteobacteria bacterium]
MSLISRYVLRECFGAWLIVTAALFVILMSNQFAVILGDAAADELPRDAVFSVLGLTTLRYLTFLAPIGLFLGTMLALARLTRDSEMTALSACGVGPTRLLAPIGLLTLALAAVSTWLVLVQTPAASRRIAEIRDEAREAVQLSALEPGQFASPDNGDTVLYAREVEGDELRDVFLERQNEGRVVAIRAERGTRIRDPKTGTLSFVLSNGTRYEGTPGTKDFSIVSFGEHGIPIRDVRPEDEEPDAATKSTAELLRSSAPADRAELELRLSTPISLFVLGLLAVPLSRASPREGRYARIGAGLLIYIIYSNAINIGLVWVEQQRVPVWAGVWWIHAVAVFVALFWLGREAGWFLPRSAAPARTR